MKNKLNILIFVSLLGLSACAPSSKPVSCRASCGNVHSFCSGSINPSGNNAMDQFSGTSDAGINQQCRADYQQCLKTCN